MALSKLYNEVFPFIVIIATEAILVGVNVIYKAATLKGLSYYALIVYSYSISSIILLFPLCYVLKRSRGLPPFKASIFFKILVIGVLGFAAELCGVQGMQYASPTLSSTLSILVPILTFILSVLFRMEKLALRSKSTQAKIFGTVLSIIGALFVVLYKGHIIFSNSNSLQLPTTDSPISLSSPRNWVIGGSLLVVQYLLLSIILIIQSHVMTLYPSEIVGVFIYCVCVTVISAPTCLLLETNPSAWKIIPDIRLVTILCWGILNTCLSTLVYAWAVRLKGALYVSIFKPASIVIAATLSVIFLGDSLYVGTVFGAMILSFGLYAVIWGKAKEEELSEEIDEGRTDHLPNSKTPLLQGSKVKDNSEIMYTNCP
ncbi:PREDICTED: WAT1-related protein At4g15540-like [Lupinus angustifolius]|uniref:WAT1-related protein At4g15540-like n=1 Tax=Lupinus angustifolius TaxID=3871 RepID=UPI00092EA532|nr:PREDICTED: WAT1-related protein At4g15540-like [Lupinus angustifolius]